MDSGTIMQRLDRLERMVRWWQGLTALLIAFVSMLILMGQAAQSPRTIEVQQVTLRDSDGNVRLILGRPFGWSEGPNSPYGVFLYNQQMKNTGSFYDQVGTAALSMVGPQSEIMLAAEERQATLNLTAYKDRQAWQSRMDHLMSEYGSGKISRPEYLSRLNEVSPGRTFVLISSEDDKPSITWTDGESNTRAVLGHIELKQKRTGTIERRPPSSFILLDDNGKVIWSVP